MSVPSFANDPAVLDHPAPDRLPGLLEQEIRRIYERSPLYGQRFPLHEGPLHWNCYREIPALSKKEIVERGHTSFFSDYREIERGLQEKRYEYESTSGTTSGPMTVIMEDGWWNAQTARAYRAHPLLARAVLRRKVAVPSVKVVILTYGKASLQHSRRIAEAFPAKQVDLYGSTEAGYIFVGEAFKDDSRVIDSNAFVELEPYRKLGDTYQIYVTTRDREAMPLLRYHTGDIVKKLSTGYRLLGRERDLYFRPDSSLVSPSEVDAALPENFSCWHYSLVQTAENRWDFHYVSDHIAPKETEPALARMLGDGVRVNAFRRRVIAPAASGKFSLLKPLAS